MKKKIALLLSLIMSLVAIFAFGVMGASADTTEQKGWVVTAKDAPVIVGGSVAVEYELTYDGIVVEELGSPIVGDENFITAKPIVKIYDGEKELAGATGNVINTEKMEVGEKTLTLKVYDLKKKELASASFKLTVAKKDNTMTIIMIVLIVLIVGYLIWSNYSNKKKQKQAQTKASELKIGDRVKTIGGVCGFVSEINDAENTFTLEVGANSFVKFDKGAIYQTAPAQGSAVAKEEKAEENVSEKAEEKKEDK